MLKLNNTFTQAKDGISSGKYQDLIRVNGKYALLPCADGDEWRTNTARLFKLIAFRFRIQHNLNGLAQKHTLTGECFYLLYVYRAYSSYCLAPGCLVSGKHHLSESHSFVSEREAEEMNVT